MPVDPDRGGHGRESAREGAQGGRAESAGGAGGRRAGPMGGEGVDERAEVELRGAAQAVEDEAPLEGAVAQGERGMAARSRASSGRARNAPALGGWVAGGSETPTTPEGTAP